MPRPGTRILLVFVLFVLFASCRDKKPVSISQISRDPHVQEHFDQFLNALELKPGTNDSLIYSKINEVEPLLDNDGRMLLYRKIGEYYYRFENQDSAMFYFRKGLDLASKSGDSYYQALFHLMCGSVYTNISDFVPALAELKTAYHLSTSIDSLRLQIRAARSLGNAYWDIGDYDLALDFYFISLEKSREADNRYGIASALNNIGNVYQQVKKFDQALNYFRQAEAISEKEHLDRIIAIANNNLGNVYSDLKNYDSAFYYFKRAIEKVKSVESKYDAGIYIGNLADLYLQTDSLDKSEASFWESLQFANETGDKTGVASCNLGLAEVYLRRNDTKGALPFLETGTVISEEIGTDGLKMQAYGNYSEYFLKKGDFVNSRKFLEKQMIVKDSIYEQKSGEAVARLENQYAEIQSMRQIELLKTKQKNILYLSILGTSAFIVIFILTFLAYRSKTRSNLILQEKNEQIEASRDLLKERNQQLIESREQLYKVNKGKDDFLTIISHDLKNPLSSIRGFTELLLRSYDTFNDEERKKFLNEIFDSIERISLLINNILYWVKSQTEEIQIIPSNFNLHKRSEENISIYKLILINKQISVENFIPEDLSVHTDINVFDMILRNILSNSLKFTPSGGSITLRATIAGKMVSLSVNDTGIGIPGDKLKLILNRNEQYSTTGTSHEQGTGLGLGLVSKFIEQTEGSLSIDSEEGKGTTITFTIPAAG
jgi:signal transduction histidine kinase